MKKFELITPNERLVFEKDTDGQLSLCVNDLHEDGGQMEAMHVPFNAFIKILEDMRDEK